MKPAVTLVAGPIDLADVPPLEEEGREQLVAEFSALVAALTERNRGNAAWWFTWLSCRDRLNVDLLGVMELLARLAATPIRGQLEVRVPDLVTRAVVRDAAREAGWEVTSARGSWPVWLRAASTSRMRRIIDVLTFLRFTTHAMIVARRVFPRVVGARSIDVVLVTIFESRNLTADGWRDEYFGPLASELAAHGERVLTLGLIRNNSLGTLRSAATADLPVVPIARIVTGRDLARSLAVALRARFVPVATPVPLPLLRRAFHAETISIASASLVHAGMTSILAANPRARVIHLFENNSWERACELAAAEAHPPRPTVGYLHCAVVPAHLKYHFVPGEVDRGPFPGQIVCTGPTARAALLALGALPASRVAAGCALRGPTLADVPTSQRARQLGVVLVLLEGLWTMAPLLELVLAAAPLLAGVRIIVRSHPALPATEIADRADLDLRATGIELSTEPDPVADISRADVVVYKGTTLALSALWMGVPVVHVDTAELVSDDPLVGLDSFKSAARTPTELAEACARLVAQPDDVFEREWAAAREYVAGYLAPRSDAGFAPFLRAQSEG